MIQKALICYFKTLFLRSEDLSARLRDKALLVTDI